LHAQSRKKPYDLHLKEKFKKYRNYLNSAIKKAKFDFYGDKIKKCNNDPKLIWKTIKEATQGHPNTKIKTLHIDINNTIYTNKTHPLKIADHFNEFFANITSKNANNYINTTESSVDNIVPSLPL
ncbi:myb-like protein D, partial [Aphis craccivora]